MNFEFWFWFVCIGTCFGTAGLMGMILANVDDWSGRRTYSWPMFWVGLIASALLLGIMAACGVDILHG